MAIIEIKWNDINEKIFVTNNHKRNAVLRQEFFDPKKKNEIKFEEKSIDWSNNLYSYLHCRRGLYSYSPLS